LGREEAAHREHVQTHTRAVEALSRTELEYKRAQLQAMQLLHAIDAVVAAGGPPGQKDAELADVQRLLERTRDAHNEARVRLEEVSTLRTPGYKACACRRYTGLGWGERACFKRQSI